MRINLIEPIPAQFGQFDAIFLRNVMIYFDRETRQKVSENLARYLKPNGQLVIGHAESLHGISDRLKSVEPTIYAVSSEGAGDTAGRLPR
jgi:chemotaxis protein methyltransferase CheR